MKKAGILLLCLLMPFGSAFAEQGKPLSVELLWQLKRIGSPVVSPSGEHIIAPVTEYDLKKIKVRPSYGVLMAKVKIIVLLQSKG